MRELAVVHLPNVIARHLDSARRRPVDSGDNVQKGCLAGTRWAGDGKELPGLDAEADLSKGPDRLRSSPVDAADRVDFNDRASVIDVRNP
jgi:hypothetical protein